MRVNEKLTVFPFDGTRVATKISERSIHRDHSLAIAIELKGRVYAPIIDGHGNIVKLIDPESRLVTHSYTYSAFGEILSVKEGPFNPWRFQGKRYDPDTGLVDFGSRFYSPKTARWLTPDPLGSACSTNLYQYCYNNPFKYCDPDGKEPITITCTLLTWGTALVFGEAAVVTAGTVICGFLLYEVATYHPDTFRTATLGIPYAFYDVYKNNKPRTESELEKNRKGKEKEERLKGLGSAKPTEGPEGTEWRGKGLPESMQGNWYDPQTQESFHPDLDHGPPIGPHWDYKGPLGEARIYPDNEWIWAN